MSQWDKFRQRVLGKQADNNIDFATLCTYLQRLGFSERMRGSHHVFDLAGIERHIDLQPGADGKARDYQVEQVRDFIERNGL